MYKTTLRIKNITTHPWNIYSAHRIAIPAGKAWGCESCMICLNLSCFSCFSFFLLVFLGFNGSYWSLLVPTGPYWSLLLLTGPYCSLLLLTGHCWALLGALLHLLNWLTNLTNVHYDLLGLLSQPKKNIGHVCSFKNFFFCVLFF